MPSRTKPFQLFPWIGGVNTSLDPATIPSNQLIKAQNLVFGTRGSRKKREGIKFNWDTGTTASESIIGQHDFWYGTTSRSQRLVAVTDGKKVYSHSSGTRSADLFAGTAWSSSITNSSFEVINNLLIIAVDGTGNVLKKWTGSGNIADLGGTPPVASIVREHLSRLWCNDKTNPDRLHYSPTGDPETWNGAGDSGALDIAPGDGDPEGITAIFPTFKGVLFVAKKSRIYKVTGSTPETFKVELVTRGLGCVSHNSIAMIDQDDIVFASQKGFHSLAATDVYGDFEGAYLSADIQATFNEKFTRSRLKYIWGAYLPEINSCAFAVTDSDVSTTANNTIWLYNFPLKSWYSWPNVSCQSLIVSNDSDKKRFYLGTNTTRIGKSFNGTNYDISTAGANVAVPMTIKTGIIYVDNDPRSIKGFKNLGLIYKPVGTHQLTVTVKIDNYGIQSLSYSQTGSADLLGSSFILGSSILGYDVVLAPYEQTVDGYGRGIQVTIEQTGTDQQVEIQGLSLGWEPAEHSQETVLTES